jgi:hypothetical protein
VQHDFSLIEHQGNVLEWLAAAVPSAASSLASATDGICPEQRDTSGGVGGGGGRGEGGEEGGGGGRHSIKLNERAFLP